MGLDVAVEVVADEVVVAVVDDGVAEGREVASVTEHVAFDGVKHLLEIRVEFEVAVGMGMAKVLYVLCKIAKEEDVVLANLTGDFNLY